MKQGQLPEPVRQALQAAAKTPTTWLNPLARAKAIEVVLAQAKARYPEFFNKE